MMPRRVSSLVYWLLNAGVNSLWLLALDTIVLDVRNLSFVVWIGFALWFAAGMGGALIAEGKAAREEKRPRANFGEVADRPVGLRDARWDLATAQRFLFELAGLVLVFGGLGALVGHTLHPLPWGVPTLVLYAAARRLVPASADEAPNWRPATGPVAGS